jgi:hypothetical protein
MQRAQVLGVLNPIFANIGVPMIVPQVALMGIALLPIVLIETVSVRKTLQLNFWKAIKDTGIANLWTTFLGVPLAWAAMLVLALLTTGGRALGMNTPVKMLAAVTLQAAWLIPYEEHLFWMIPGAATVLLFPCFLASFYIERFVLLRRWQTFDRKLISSAVFRANAWSYLFLFIAGTLWTVASIVW